MTSNPSLRSHGGSDRGDRRLPQVRKGKTPVQPDSHEAGTRRVRKESLSPAERSLRARAAAHRLHSLHDSRELTTNARRAFNDRFVNQVDPDRRLPPAERLRRAECARRAYFAALAAKSARARRMRRQTYSRPVGLTPISIPESSSDVTAHN
jgi:hypothetical protein